MPRLVPHLKTDKLKQMNANGERSSNARQRRAHAPLDNGNKYEYCQRWIMDQKPREAKLMPADRPAESDDRKKRQVSVHCLCIVHVYEDRDEHRTRSPLCKSLSDTLIFGQSSLQAPQDRLEQRSSPLLYFVLKYLQRISHRSEQDHIQSSTTLLNTFAARCFLDFFDNKHYLQRIKLFIQKQLRKIKIRFIEQITITSIHLGDRLPEIQVTASARRMPRSPLDIQGRVQGLD